MVLIKEIADLQVGYKKLVTEKRVTKQAICNLVVPFRDKYKLSDKDALRIARGEVDFAETAKLLELWAVQELTLDELRNQNFGDNPFWVNIFADGCWTHWPAIKDQICGKEVAVWCATKGEELDFADYGKTWVAYKYKPGTV